MKCFNSCLSELMRKMRTYCMPAEIEVLLHQESWIKSWFPTQIEHPLHPPSTPAETWDWIGEWKDAGALLVRLQPEPIPYSSWTRIPDSGWRSLRIRFCFSSSSSSLRRWVSPEESKCSTMLRDKTWPSLIGLLRVSRIIVIDLVGWAANAWLT